jgi:hypothetical protein
MVVSEHWKEKRRNNLFLKTTSFCETQHFLNMALTSKQRPQVDFTKLFLQIEKLLAHSIWQKNHRSISPIFSAVKFAPDVR